MMIQAFMKTVEWTNAVQQSCSLRVNNIIWMDDQDRVFVGSRFLIRQFQTNVIQLNEHMILKRKYIELENANAGHYFKWTHATELKLSQKIHFNG